ncbi:hypothetical protein ACIQUQ_25640 [Streptomyces sp. NPDC101118]|uniref:hypothetical protein n=1 Tax=Streptomyces sp. NPDC101118 TaxID=3366109 RepID=UPI0037F324E1
MSERYESHFEEALRGLLAEDAGEVRPAPAPYAAIVRQGRAERRRRALAVGAAVIALTVVPAGAFALADFGGHGTGGVAAPAPTAVKPTSGTASPEPGGPAAPATPGQLADGITLEQATQGLTDCLAVNGANGAKDAQRGTVAERDYGRAEDYRLLLAVRSTGDDNAPGDGIHVVAVKDKAPVTRLICTVKDGKAVGINASVGGEPVPGEGKVVPDINGQKLYRQAVITSPGYRLPFRWGAIGTVDPSIARVTVAYGDGSPAQAALDHGWYAATGVLTEQPGRAPHVVGYDAAGQRVYDSDEDRTYDRAL